MEYSGFPLSGVHKVFHYLAQHVRKRRAVHATNLELFNQADQYHYLSLAKQLEILVPT